MGKTPKRPFPPRPLADAERVASAIKESNAGRPINKILLGEALKTKPTSSAFRELLSAALQFGFTTGSWTSDTIGLSERGQRVTKPRSEDERLQARREAVLDVPLFRQVLSHFDNHKLPPSEFLKNALEREPYNVPAEHAAEAAKAVIRSARSVDFLRDVGGDLYVILQSGSGNSDDVDKNAEAAESDDAPPLAGYETAVPNGRESHGASSSLVPEFGEMSLRRLRFFIGHGSKKEPLEQLKRILQELRIEFVVAEEEPNRGRPISEKVKDLMKSCTGGIFIFSADEEFKTIDGQAIFRPRENVVYELGAASLLYAQKIVILKEAGVAFPTNFRDLGYIEFDGSGVKATSMELLKELISLGAVKLAAA